MDRKGFTLIEMLIVVAIVTALAAIAMPYYEDYMARAKTAATVATAQTVAQAIALHDQEAPYPFNYASPCVELIGTYLQEYRKNASNPYETPRDGWGAQMLWVGSNGFVLSAGPNRIFDTKYNGPVTNRTEAASFTAPLGDDIGASWKPMFFISSIANVSGASATFQLKFTRPIKGTPGISSFTFSCSNATYNPGAVRNVTQISQNVWEFTCNNSPTTVSGVNYYGAVTGQTGPYSLGVAVNNNVRSMDGQLGIGYRPDLTAGWIATYSM